MCPLDGVLIGEFVRSPLLLSITEVRSLVCVLLTFPIEYGRSSAELLLCSPSTRILVLRRKCFDGPKLMWPSGGSCGLCFGDCWVCSAAEAWLCSDCMLKRGVPAPP